MSRTGKFFFAMAWFGLGAIVGFMIAPIKQGMNISICSNNTDTAFGCGDDAEETDDADAPEELVLE